MIVKKLKESKEFLAGDGTLFRELLNPAKDDAKINYSLGIAKVKPGCRTKRHVLTSTEVYCIVRGKGIMHTGKESEKVEEGCAVFIPANAEQWIENTGREELAFFCIVEPAWKPECEKILGQ